MGTSVGDGVSKAAEKAACFCAVGKEGWVALWLRARYSYIIKTDILLIGV
jgi:hypothetical protein